MTRAEKVIAFIERYCVTPEGADVGKPLLLADFQKKFIRDVYDNPAGTRRAILSVARKNGKSGLIAGLLLAYLVGPEAKQNSQLVSGAMSRDQAALVFNLASKMVQQSPALSQIVRIVPSGKRLLGLNLNTEFHALAADGKTAHGLSPVLAILDEVGQVRGPQSDFVDAIITSQGAHENPLQVIISTQAASDADLLSTWIDDAKASQDPRIVCHLYAAPAGCDLMDEAAWRAANPALGLFRSLEDLRDQMQQAERMPSMSNTARNLLLNQRVSLDSPFISPDVWAACRAEPEPFDGPIYAGLDLSARTDLTALVLIGKAGSVWQVRSYFWTPEQGLLERARKDRAPYDTWARQGFIRTTPGATVDLEAVALDLADVLSDCDVQAIAYDRWRIDVLKKELERLGLDLPLVPHGQGFKDMAPALDALEIELLNGRLAHGAHPVLTMCAANAVATKDPSGNRKLDKSRRTGRIDGLQALAMAFGASLTAEAPADIDTEVYFV
ncbi:TPA: terminase large subunit [Pseudomonas aeruginosa]|uniref:terminase large subunit n=1 Tax=Pseudomonas aeruginosa TaxID=287 RepID=UPI001ADA1CC0|nr:terminase TerL endonuclease subunit [Pseudomonas aeruginosa]EKX9247936.1 terminase large subunit [Pseudomonas aeruginosa]MBO8395496.1 terminase large subunit [Pseudomonas aeruginosa]MCG7130080.1 terminase large subunit [Pseudomonas aeruginosa]MCG7153253.1 terminase large subunit [Pseudomonas aeruginosa]MCG7165780.1 terminase large subunit [Pseudomonas aeruginosa]